MSPSAWWWRAVEKWSWNTHLRSCDHIGHPEIIILRYFKYNLTLCQKTSTFWVLQSCPAGNSSKPFGILTEKKLDGQIARPPGGHCWPVGSGFEASILGISSFFFQVFGYHLLLEMNLPHSWDGQTVPFQTSPVLGEPRGFFSESWLKIHIFFTSLWFWYHLPISL